MYMHISIYYHVLRKLFSVRIFKLIMTSLLDSNTPHNTMNNGIFNKNNSNMTKNYKNKDIEGKSEAKTRTKREKLPSK